MANTYTQIHLQCIFAVKYRLAVVDQAWQERLYQYITAIVQRNQHKMLCINGMPDHVHLLIGFRPTQSLSDLMRLVKGESSEWINQQRFTGNSFRWQEGYGAFSYTKSHVSAVFQYIENQQEHHRKRTFLEEYEDFLKRFEIEYDQQYIFKPLE